MDISDSTIVSRILARFGKMTLAPKWVRPAAFCKTTTIPSLSEGGFGLNLLDGSLTVLGLTHDGPEDPHDNHDWRYINDIATMWKITKRFTSMTDLNLVDDTVKNGKWGGGVAQYFTYSLIDWLQLGVWAEIWRDSGALYAAQYGGNNDVIHFIRGDNLSPSFPRDPGNLGDGHTTYFEVTGV